MIILKLIISSKERQKFSFLTRARTHARTHAHAHTRTHTHAHTSIDIFQKPCIFIPNTSENNYNMFLQHLKKPLPIYWHVASFKRIYRSYTYMYSI